MKILISGVGGRGNTESAILSACEQLGLEVLFVDSSEYFHLTFLNRVLIHFSKVPYYWGVRPLNNVLLEQAKKFKPDFVLFLKPIFILPDTLEQLKKFTRIFSWYPDYVLFPKTASTYFFKTIPIFDVHFSFNYANSFELIKLGARRSLFLPCAADPTCHRPEKISSQAEANLGADVVFVGTYAKEERSEYLERLCRDGYDVKIYGNSWEKHPRNSCLRKRGCIQLKEVSCGEMSKVLNASKIVLAFVRKHNDEVLACRSYEIPACGAFMLHERTSKIGEVLKEDEEAVFFSSYEEMKGKIDFYLREEGLRKKIAEAGRQRVMHGGNLMADRIKDMIEVFKAL